LSDLLSLNRRCLCLDPSGYDDEGARVKFWHHEYLGTLTLLFLQT